MTDNLKYGVIKQFKGHDELVNALEQGNDEDKRHALLSISYSDTNGELAIDLFLAYIDDPVLKFNAYMCIDNFLETCRSFPLLKVLPILIAGMDDGEIRSHCESALENLVSPGKITGVDLTFDSFQIPFDSSQLRDYLDSSEADKIIIGLLYTFHNPHIDQEFLKLLSNQIKKEIKSVSCIVGKMIDTKLWKIIEDLEALEQITLASYSNAVKIGVGGKSKWIYDRFDRIHDFASEQMKRIKSESSE